MNRDEPAERMEREADRLEEQSDRIGRRIEETRRDWESKEHDASIPGAQPEPDDDEEPVAGAESDPGG